MKLILKKDGPYLWTIVTETGNILGGPKQFMNQMQAEEWARNFITTWDYASLYIEGKDT